MVTLTGATPVELLGLPRISCVRFWKDLMKLHWILFGLLVAMCVVFGRLFFLEELPFVEVPGVDGTATAKVYQGHGYEHDTFPSMNQGGSGEARHGPIFWHALAFGVLQLAFMIGLLAFGTRRDEGAGALVIPLAIGATLWITVFVLLMFSYRGFMLEDTHGLFLSLPKPTAWFILGLWPFQFFFVVVYVWGFSKAVVTDEDVARFQEILQAKRQGEGGEA